MTRDTPRKQCETSRYLAIPCDSIWAKPRETPRNRRETARYRRDIAAKPPPSDLRISSRLHFEASKIPPQPPPNDYHPLLSIFCTSFSLCGDAALTTCEPPMTGNQARNLRETARNLRETCAKPARNHAITDIISPRNHRETIQFVRYALATLDIGHSLRESSVGKLWGMKTSGGWRSKAPLSTNPNWTKRETTGMQAHATNRPRPGPAPTTVHVPKSLREPAKPPRACAD